MASEPVMELDGKTVATLVAAVVAGGGSGFATVEVKTQVDVARMEARLGSLEDAFRGRVLEADRDHQLIRESIQTNFDASSERVSIAVKALNDRLDRLDERKMDK